MDGGTNREFAWRVATRCYLHASTQFSDSTPSGLVVVWWWLVRLDPDVIGPLELGNVALQECLLDLVEELGVAEQVLGPTPLRRSQRDVEELYVWSRRDDRAR